MDNCTFSRSIYDPKPYDGKKLIVFRDEGGGYPYTLSTWPSADGESSTLTATAVGIASHQIGKENRISVIEMKIDARTLTLLEKPRSRFLNNQCDFVLFLNSPRRKARFTEAEGKVNL